MPFIRVAEIISGISLGLSGILIITLRCCWRRGKPLQEP